VPVLPPRLVVAGTHSGVGKTTVATGLMAALRAAGHRVAGAKVGPDFIDPGYHALATGRPSRSLDPWLSGPELVPALAGRAGDGADVLVVEGVMGMFDGSGDGTPASTADVAVALDAPVVLVVDAWAMAQSAAAVVRGFATHDPRVRLAGVVLNNVASDGHEAMLRKALAPVGIPVLGVLRRDDRLVWRERQLGLVPVAEGGPEVRSGMSVLAAVVAAGCDLAAVVGAARSGVTRVVPEVPMPEPVAGAPVRIALATGKAFSFTYPDNVEALTAAGAELVPFDPLDDAALPDGCRGLVAGGGFPEVFAEGLAENGSLLDDVRRRVVDGLVVWAECGGLLWLAGELDGRPMAGALPVTARMTDRLTLGYRSGRTTVDSPLGPTGTGVRGHEFHYSVTEPAGDALDLAGVFGAGATGFATPTLLASYLHVHLASRPDLARAFVSACTAVSSP
jgi:cobyrinic acid a,c-diamide synthase